jgi:tRNA(fMet)-specific endonuclease VapC
LKVPQLPPNKNKWVKSGLDPTLNVDVETADFYASILNNLRAAGTPIPTNDIWIAALAFQHGYKILSKDKHFSFIPGLMQIA